MTQFRRALACLLLALSATACEYGGTLPPPYPPSTDSSWIQRNAIPLLTTEPGADETDLEPLRDILERTDVVALGEATHGTREFFRMKHRILEFLVREMEFNTFAIEAPWAEAQRLNHYIQTGEGDPRALLRNLKLWPWNTTEVLEMVEWMREHNQNPRGAPTISFHGFDAQFSRVAMGDVMTYMRGVSQAAADSMQARYACFLPWQDDFPNFPDYAGGTTAAQKETCRQGVEAAYAQMQAGAAAYTAASSPEAYRNALQAARIVVQNEHLQRDPEQAFNLRLRDKYMAENAQWIAGERYSGRKTVLWGHNAHVWRLEQRMGTLLTTAYREAYTVVGFSFYQGSFTAIETGVGFKTPGAVPAAQDSYEHRFHQVGLPVFMLDLAPVRAGHHPAANWLMGPRNMRIIGATYNPAAPNQFYANIPLAEAFDVLIHVEESTPTQRLPMLP